MIQLNINIKYSVIAPPQKLKLRSNVLVQDKIMSLSCQHVSLLTLLHNENNPNHL